MLCRKVSFSFCMLFDFSASFFDTTRRKGSPQKETTQVDSDLSNTQRKGSRKKPHTRRLILTFISWVLRSFCLCLRWPCLGICPHQAKSGIEVAESKSRNRSRGIEVAESKSLGGAFFLLLLLLLFFFGGGGEVCFIFWACGL